MAQTEKFYNADEGPQTQPDVELPRRAHYDIATSPNMFGGLIAQGLKEAGTGINDAVNTFGQVAADQATNNFMGQLTDLRSGFENTRGQDTMQSHDDYIKNLQKVFDQNRSTVPPQFQPEYDRFSRRYLFNANESAASHLAQQSNSWAQGVAVSKDQTATAAISANPNDEQNFQLNQEQMAKAAVNQLQLKMGIHDYAAASPEAQGMIRNAYDQARARAAYARIEAVRPSDPGQALAWQQQYAPILGKLGPEVQNQLKGYEQQQKISQGVQEANAAVAGGTQIGQSQDDKAHAAVGHLEENPSVALISAREGFRSTAYWDVNHWRTGYGSDTITLPDGSTRSVTQGTTVTREDANRDLARRTNETQARIAGQVGFGRWQSLTPGAQAALTSMSYNYGLLPFDVQAAVRGGSTQDVARMIEGHAGDNGGVNRSRRLQEASIVMGGPIPAGFASSGGTAQPSGLSEPGPAPPLSSAMFEPPLQHNWGPAHAGGTPTGPIIAAPGGTPDQGGTEGGQSGTGPSIQPASLGGGGGGAPAQQGQAPAVYPDQQSVYDVARDNVSKAMMYTMGRKDLDEKLKDSILAEQEKQLRQATFVAEQDAQTKAKHSNEAVDRSLQLAMGVGGAPPSAQAGFSALTDAFRRGVIDEPAYERGTAAITKFSGQEDLRAYGPGYADIMTGKTKINSLADIQALAAHGDLTKKGYDAAKADLAYAEKGESGSYLTQKKYAYEQAQNYLQWELPGPPGAGNIRNPKAGELMNDFARMFENDAELYRKEDPKMKGFPYFDGKKLEEKLQEMYSPQQKARDMGQGGLSKPAAEAADQTWAATAHPPAPAGYRQDAWAQTVANPPQTPDGFALPHAEWDLRLRTLAGNPTQEIRQFWDARYGPKGTVAIGPTADHVLRELRGGINRPGTPTPSGRVIELRGDETPGQALPGMVEGP